MRIGLSQPARAMRCSGCATCSAILAGSGRAANGIDARAQGLRGPLTQALDQVRGLFIADDFDASAANGAFA